jgi:hypothetical protein
MVQRLCRGYNWVSAVTFGLSATATLNCAHLEQFSGRPQTGAFLNRNADCRELKTDSQHATIHGETTSGS